MRFVQFALGAFALYIGLGGDRSLPGNIACFISAGFCFGVGLSSVLDRRYR